MNKITLSLITLLFTGTVAAQCDITQKMHSDGTMYFHAELLLFYKTSQFQLWGNIVTDRENYFLRLRPKPFPEKPKGTKLKDDLIVKLANDTSYTLTLYDARYTDKDTGFTMLYLFDKKDIPSFLHNDVTKIELNMGEKPQTYTFRLHKDAIRVQINCFIQKKNNF